MLQTAAGNGLINRSSVYFAWKFWPQDLQEKKSEIVCMCFQWPIWDFCCISNFQCLSDHAKHTLLGVAKYAQSWFVFELGVLSWCLFLNVVSSTFIDKTVAFPNRGKPDVFLSVWSSRIKREEAPGYFTRTLSPHFRRTLSVSNDDRHPRIQEQNWLHVDMHGDLTFKPVCSVFEILVLILLLQERRLKSWELLKIKAVQLAKPPTFAWQLWSPDKTFHASEHKRITPSDCVHIQRVLGEDEGL